jgi:hypothetical protein
MALFKGMSKAAGFLIVLCVGLLFKDEQETTKDVVDSANQVW